MTSPQMTKAANARFCDSFETGFDKSAAEASESYLRLKLREEGFARKLMDFKPVVNSELTRRLDTDLPMIIVDKEPDNPPAMSLAFAGLPTNIYLLGDRFPVYFNYLFTPRFTKDINSLRTYEMDLRQVVSDNSLKDLMAEEDSTLIAGINTALGGQDTVNSSSGVIQWQSIPGGISRTSFTQALQIMPTAPGHLEARNFLLNNVTVYEFLKWGRDEWGGDISMDLAKDGWGQVRFAGKDGMTTIKRDLVPDNQVYFMAHPKFVGRAYELQPPTMYIDRDGPMIEWYFYEVAGMSIGSTFGLASATFV